MNHFVTGRGRGGPWKMNVPGITRIRFIRFGHNRAWTYYLRLETACGRIFHFYGNPRWSPAFRDPQIGQI